MTSSTKLYYVNHNACASLADAEEVQQLYQMAGVTADIVTETEYFELVERIEQ